MRQDQLRSCRRCRKKADRRISHRGRDGQVAGHGMDPGSMTQQTRGDRYWCKEKRRRDAVADRTGGQPDERYPHAGRRAVAAGAETER